MSHQAPGTADSKIDYVPYPTTANDYVTFGKKKPPLKKTYSMSEANDGDITQTPR